MIEVERVKHMSVEEAIEVLVQDLPCETDEDLSEAMTMAIKALETVSCIKEKCAYCPHCENCDVDDETLEIKALEQQPCGDWYDVPSNEMTLEQARQAVKDLRKKLAEYLEQQPCEDAVSRADALKALDCDIKHYEFKKGVSKYMDDIVKLLDIIYVTQSNAIKALPPVTPKQQPCEDAISRRATVERLCKVADFMNEKRSGSGSPYIMAALFIQDNKNEFPSVTPKEKTGHWIIKDGKEQGYDIGGIKTWYIQIMCDKCGFIKTAIESHTGQYHFCPNCGARMEMKE